MSAQDAVGYAGDVKAVDAYQLLTENPSAVLVDVRTQAEWSYVGVPDLRSIDKAPVLIEWQTYPSGQVDLRFADRLLKALAEAGVARDAPLVFLCRSGARSRSAALAVTASGWEPCLNVSDGFEGPLDPSGHRNSLSGWRVGGLPWRQT